MIRNYRNREVIICPYCHESFIDSWEYNDTENEQKVECENDECEKSFNLYVTTKVEYTTKFIIIGSL